MIAAEIMLWGTRIGTVSLNEDTGFASFEYDREFIRSGIEIAPVAMPLSARVYTFPELLKNSFHGLPGLLADSLPDKYGNAVINSWLESQGRSAESFNAIERLCYTGKRGMGALEFSPAIGPKHTGSESLELDELVKLASKILSSRENLHISDGEAAMEQLLKVGTSAGGARAKAVIAWNEQTGDIRSGQVEAGAGYGYWLIKFDGVENNGDKEGRDSAQYTRIEYAYYLMAVDAGIDMTECRMYREGNRSHFMTRRFDRGEDGSKLHMQTLGAVAHFDFNSPGAYSYEQAAQVLRRLRVGSEGFLQLYRRMVFNVLAQNRDDHVKNISFLMDRSGAWSLSPAYDVTYAYKPDGIWTGTHQMSVNGKRDHIDRGDFAACAETMGIKASKASAIIEDVENAIKRWPDYADRAELGMSTRDKIARQLR